MHSINTGDTAWVMISSGLVLLMTPGLAFFYGGLVRRKNFLSVLMQCFMMICLITLQWILIGYSLSFGPDIKGFIGNLDWFGLKNVGLEPSAQYGTTIPHIVFMIFQGMFAIITPALILGAFAERMKFSAFCIFSVLWATFVYNPICHWVWGGGFLGADGALDFAGGTVVHINAGVAALAAALVLGKRKGYPHNVSPPHNLPFAVLGAGLLWFGWFGFNAGSALAADGIAGNAFVTTHVSAAAAGLTWSVLDWKYNARPTMLGMITGAVAGLVAITPAAGFVGPLDAIWIGVGSAIVCYIAVAVIKTKLGYDDSLDAFGVHGVGGIWGALATGLWAHTAVNANGADGLFYGNPELVQIQLKAVIVTVIYSFVVSFVLLKAIDMVLGVRVKDEDERIGLDLTQHRESSYTMLE
ncbi:MAG: ammonia channel protein [Candidatus Omnitrophica bacterium CG11_big_fil_rev_8_21_14_0_20_45_26]|uniref:Ammonium transporter n=1 Tax=Candidatus Abzuiibacterium crystallinum TaxID=1974748 RepID=A0A2H0LTE8_9BACT|nr:MAG: ammonia channel protein [Candidatus Omnitrophica bacterium CG11_big_fil_rev_8_21_14_0_20_45_26]PIW65576.1 MAG: ammonia channel protein [Candidatus Omnitrophica bacterium CG12_big_fil_rev_8_21_14_0_65_45_16]